MSGQDYIYDAVFASSKDVQLDGMNEGSEADTGMSELHETLYYNPVDEFEYGNSLNGTNAMDQDGDTEGIAPATSQAPFDSQLPATKRTDSFSHFQDGWNNGKNGLSYDNFIERTYMNESYLAPVSQLGAEGEQHQSSPRFQISPSVESNGSFVQLQQQPSMLLHLESPSQFYIKNEQVQNQINSGENISSQSDQNIHANDYNQHQSMGHQESNLPENEELSPQSLTSPSLSSVHSTQFSFFSAQQHFSRTSMDQPTLQLLRPSVEYFGAMSAYDNFSPRQVLERSFTGSLLNYIPFINDRHKLPPRHDVLPSSPLSQRSPTELKPTVARTEKKHFIRSIFKSNENQQLEEEELEEATQEKKRRPKRSLFTRLTGREQEEEVEDYLGESEKEPDYAALFENVGKRNKPKKKKEEGLTIKQEDDLSLVAFSLASNESVSSSMNESHSALALASRRILGSKLSSRKKTTNGGPNDIEVEVDLESLDLPPDTQIYPTSFVNSKNRTRGRKENKDADMLDLSKIFLCSYCSRRFKRQEHLKRHFRSLHTLEKPYDCHICHKKFSRSDNLNQHLKVHVAEE